MKKIFIAILSFFIFFVASSQPKFGIKAGLNLPDLSGDDVSDDIKNKPGFYAGGFANIPLSKNFGLQPELLWSNKGYKFEELGGEFKTTFNYIHIPVLIQFNSNGFNAETGPQIGILVSAKSKGGTLGEQDIKDSFKSLAFSWGAGVGYQLPSGFGIGIRYNIGLGSISSESSIDAKFNTLMLGLSGTFGMSSGKKN